MTARRVLPILAVAALAAGCAARTRLMGVREPDLAQIQPAHSRQQVESVLGKPLWRAGSAGGATYDIYEYAAAQSKKLVVGALTLGFDIITLGMTEYNVADMRKNAPARQSVVAYDAHDRVRAISPPWAVPLEVHGPCRRARALVPAASGMPETARPAAGPGRANAVATLRLGVRPVTINGRRTKAHVVDLPPGPYAVDCDVFQRHCTLCDAGSSSSCGAGSARVELLPGRVYRLARTRLYFQLGRQDILWIEDVDSRETLACVPSTLF